MARGIFNDAGIELTGTLRIEIFGADGGLKDTREIKNLVVTAGKNVLADRMKSAPAKAAMSHMAVGTGSTAPAAGDTTLAAELARATLTSTSVTANVITYIATFSVGVGTGALQEAGLFNASSGGDMLCRTTYSVINKGADDSMTITWTVTIN